MEGKHADHLTTTTTTHAHEVSLSLYVPPFLKHVKHLFRVLLKPMLTSICDAQTTILGPNFFMLNQKDIAEGTTSAQRRGETVHMAWTFTLEVRSVVRKLITCKVFILECFYYYLKHKIYRK